MKQAGHEVVICQLKDFRHRLISPVEDMESSGYVIFTRWCFAASGDSLFPISETEFSLFEQSIRDWKPDVIGLTNRTPYNHLLPVFIPAMRRAAPEAFIVGGGFGPTYQPEISLSLGADAVIRGEGEYALLELVEALAAGKDWRYIKNVSWMQGESLKNNPLRPLITDLDALPFTLNYGDHFISIEDNDCCHKDMRYRSADPNNTGYPILGGRGCIGHCSYCAGGNWRNQYRREGLQAPPIRQRSLENIFEELLLAKQHGEKEVVFNDEYFVRPTKELISFFKRYAREINLSFLAHFHHKQLLESPEFVKVAKDAGWKIASFGLQSASESFAREVYNRHNNNREILDSLRACHAQGISGIYHIIGNPNMESPKEEQALYDFAAQVPFDPSLKTSLRVHSTVLKIFEGTPLAEKYPYLLSHTFDMKKFSRTIILAELRNKVDAQTFDDIQQDDFYMKRPDRLFGLMLNIIHDRHYQYLYAEIERLKGKDVYFWGCGEMYHYKRHLFSELKPRCILVNKGEHPKALDNLPVLHPDKILPQGDVLPIVIFSISPNTICRTIARLYPQYTDIVACALL